MAIVLGTGKDYLSYPPDYVKRCFLVSLCREGAKLNEVKELSRIDRTEIGSQVYLTAGPELSLTRSYALSLM